MITKASSDYSKFDFQSGEVILIDKPIGWSSFKVVYKIRQAVKVKRSVMQEHLTHWLQDY